jgi:hypothetical protein
VACVAVLVIASVGSAGASPYDPEFPDFPVFPKVKVRTDGTLTVGRQETLTVKAIPRKPKMRLSAYISPPDSATGCFESLNAYCVPQPLFPVTGSRRLKRSKKGRASLTFVMPPGYEFQNDKDPLRSHPINLINGQAIHVDIEGAQRRKNFTFIAPIGHTIAVVEVPPAQSP